MEDRNGQKNAHKNKKTKNQSETKAIRISTDLYEQLRQKAYYNRTTIRQIVDDIIDKALND